MATIRARLTAWYATALAATLASFAIVLYVSRRQGSLQDLDRRVGSEADLSAAAADARCDRRPAALRRRTPGAGGAGPRRSSDPGAHAGELKALVTPPLSS